MTERGRPSEYQPEFVEQAAKLGKLGATDADLADFFNVSITTVRNWMARHEDFLAAVKSSKAFADDRVERSLYQRATGYTFDALKIFQYEGVPVQVPYREHVPPDATSMIFWLKNRRPAEWREKSETTVTTFVAELPSVAPTVSAWIKSALSSGDPS